ncbi:hypothetical protein JTE87_04207 [Bacillus amyloliquefaciens]|nr:hypothetical protein [Bacillus amyloliquefaciens]
MSIEELGYQVREYFDKYYWDEIVQVVELVNSYGGLTAREKLMKLLRLRIRGE